MKHYLILFVACILLINACNNMGTDYSTQPAKDPANIAKAQKLIKGRMEEFLGPRLSSYQSIAFTGLDSSFDNLDESADPNKKYSRQFSGFKMTHDFRALDIFNQIHAERHTYFFDNLITKIIAVRDTVPSNFLN